MLEQQRRQQQHMQQKSYFDHHRHGSAAAKRAAHRNGAARGYSDSSDSSDSSEDYRGVIDDLTVENQKLKRKLKKYQSLHDTHLQTDKLFEVRVHGLSVEKKRELEDLLKNFALSLNPSPTAEAGTLAQTTAKVGFAAPTRFLNRNYTATTTTTTTNNNSSSINNHFSNPASSATSRFADSAYASMSGQSGAASNARKQPDPSARQSSINLQSYMQDIPEGLLPKQMAFMSDKVQKKMVVRRLEQVFAGKGQTDGNPQQPQQQEEVAQSAANADRRAKRESGRRVQAEGLREARIMPAKDAALNGPLASESGPSAQQYPKSEFGGIAEEPQKKGSDSDGLSPDQRPTRPLDLDPHRAQISDENLDYMRHLGFSPTDLDSSEAPEQGRGWIYLNLLMNMAQLHTINVTPEFVKKAISSFSTKLELSRDGRKVRWKGGREVTKSSSDNSTPLDQASSVSSSPKGELSESHSGGRQQKTAHDGVDGYCHDQSMATLNLKKMSSGHAKHPLWYSPVLYRHERSEESDQSLEEFAKNNTSQNAMSAERSCLATSERASSLGSSMKHQNDGPIIFYSNARFCTDLSGECNGRQVVPPCSDNAVTSIKYKPALDHPVGDASAPASSDDGSDDSFRVRRSGTHEKGPLSINDSAQLLDAMVLHDRERGDDAGADDAKGSSPKPDAGMNVDFVPPDSLKQRHKDASGLVENEGPVMDVDGEASWNGKGQNEGFAVSGLGAVRPADNFVIDVECRLVRIDAGPDGGDENEVAAVHRSYDQTSPWKRYHPRIREALRKSDVSVPTSTSVTDFAAHSASSNDGALTAKYTLHAHRSRPLFKETIVAAQRKDLPASVLPPPVFLPFPSTSDETMINPDDDGSIEEEEVNINVKSPSDAVSTTSSLKRQRDEDVRSDVRSSGGSLVNENESEGQSDISDVGSGNDGEDSEAHTDSAKGLAMHKRQKLSISDGDDAAAAAAAATSRKADDGAPSHHPSFLSSSSCSTDDSSSSSVDFLAEARELDPEFVRAREREYAADMAERLAEEIPAGSSAATAGGGSGYNSPEDEKYSSSSAGCSGSGSNAQSMSS